MPKSKLLYYTDDSESEVEVEIENVVENPPLEKVCSTLQSSLENPPLEREPEPVNEVISVEPQKPPKIEPKKRGRKKREEPKNQSWEEYIDDNIENKMPKYNCPECNQEFKRKHFLKRHLEEMRCSAVREKLKEEKNMLEEQKKQMEQNPPLKKVEPKKVKNPPKQKEVKNPPKQKEVKNLPLQPQNQGRPAITFRFA